jgi:hypothetical protein
MEPTKTTSDAIRNNEAKGDPLFNITDPPTAVNSADQIPIGRMRCFENAKLPYNDNRCPKYMPVDAEFKVFSLARQSGLRLSKC